MTLPFDYAGYWRKSEPTAWKSRCLHWHCYACRMDGAAYGDEAARRDLTTELAPKVVRDWLGKPAGTLQAVATTPEEGVTWMRSQWEPIKSQIGVEADAISDGTRFGQALYDLRCGNDLCWGFWLNKSTHLHLAVVGTSQRCH